MDSTMIDLIQWRKTNPRTSKYVPVVNIEELSESLNILYKIPGSILIRVSSPR